jgi:hypothetical protein
MRQRQAFIIAAVGILVLGLAFASGQGQDKRAAPGHIRIEIPAISLDLDKEDLKDLRRLESLTGMRIRVRGLDDLDNRDRPRTLRIDIDLKGLHDAGRELARLGERIGRRLTRELGKIHSRELHEALKALKNIRFDIDID